MTTQTEITNRLDILETGERVCNSHTEIAVSCSKIESIHEIVKSTDHKIDGFHTKLDDAMKKAFEMNERISVLETKKTERWRVQGWWNKTLAGGLVAVILGLALEWAKFHGGK